MADVRGSLLDREKHRRLPESNIQQLQQALCHWRTLDAEYEALKEEIQCVPNGSQSTEFRRIQKDFEGELVDRKEVDDIIGRHTVRTRDQIVNLLDRRVDYVTRNIDDLKKQLEAAQNKYATANVISQPDALGDEGEPITDVVEELDEDDNVVSYHLNTPRDSLPHIRESLEKAGVQDIPPSQVQEEGAGEPALAEGSKPRSMRPKAPPPSVKSVSQHSEVSAPKKVVSFSDVKYDGATQAPMSHSARRVEQIMKAARDQEIKAIEEPIIPDDEDPEDAALRQEMLKYGMGEVGAVVAELQIDEDDYDEAYDAVYDSDMDEDDEDEDKYGRSTRKTVTDEYRRRMLELETRLKVKSRFTQGAEKLVAAQDSDSGSEDGRIGCIVVNQGGADAHAGSTPAPSSKQSFKDGGPGRQDGKKGVRFARSLDIASDEEPIARQPSKVKEGKKVVDPLSDVIERSSPRKPVERKSTQTTSRFRRNREVNGPADSPVTKGPLNAPSKFLDQASRPVPSGPDGATITDTLIERDTKYDPTQGEAFEATSSFQEVAEEHYRLRNTFIQRHGGYLQNDELPSQRLDEGEGGAEKTSRFKAARLSRH